MCLKGLNVAAGVNISIDAFGIKSGEEASYKNYDIRIQSSCRCTGFAGFVNTIGDDKTRNAKAVYIDLEQDFTKKFLVTGAFVLKITVISDQLLIINFLPVINSVTV